VLILVRIIVFVEFVVGSVMVMFFGVGLQLVFVVAWV